MPGTVSGPGARAVVLPLEDAQPIPHRGNTRLTGLGAVNAMDKALFQAQTKPATRRRRHTTSAQARRWRSAKLSNPPTHPKELTQHPPPRGGGGGIPALFPKSGGKPDQPAHPPSDPPPRYSISQALSNPLTPALTVGLWPCGRRAQIAWGKGALSSETGRSGFGHCKWQSRGRRQLPF